MGCINDEQGEVMKVCSKCKIEKDITMFVRDKTKHDGYRSSCKECRVKSGDDKRFRDRHKNRLANYHREYRELNREETNKNSRDYRSRDRARSRAIVKNARHKRREIESISNLTGIELKKWSDTQTKICSYCGEYCKANYEIDHIVPLANGGRHEIENLTISCSPCNKRKNSNEMIVFMAQRHTVNLAMIRGA